MPKKRKNGGKCRHNRGSARTVHCDISGAIVPKDKAIIKYIVKNVVGPSGQKDVKDASYYDRPKFPKIRYKAYICISAAVHRRLVRCRPKVKRKTGRDHHAQIKKFRTKQNERIQKARRERRKVNSARQRATKSLRRNAKDTRQPTKYLINNPQYMNIVKRN